MADETPTTGGNTDAPALTFQDAYAADTSPVSDPATPETTPPAAAQPAGTSGSPQERSAYIPRDRFDEVNTRLKAAEQWKQQYGWAESVDQQVLQEAAQWYGRYKGDPVDFVQQLIAEMQSHPQHGERLRSLAGKALQQARQPAAPTPLPVLQLEDGTTVDLNALKAQWLQDAEARFAPVMQTATELKEERDHARAVAEADTFATDFLTEVRQLPDFTTHEPAIKRDLAAQIQAGKVGDHPAELRDAVRALYIKHAVPSREAAAGARTLDDLQRKAQAARGVNPGASAPTSHKRPTSFLDPSLKW